MNTEEYYIASPYNTVGNCVLWWAEDAKGYTCNLKAAWRVSKEKALSILSDKRGDKAYLASDIDKLSVQHFDFQYFRAVKELK